MVEPIAELAKVAEEVVAAPEVYNLTTEQI